MILVLQVHYEFSVCEVWSPMGDYDENDTPFVKTYRVRNKILYMQYNENVLKMSELPDDLHWKNSRFMSGVVLITKPGTSVVTVSWNLDKIVRKHASATRMCGWWKNSAASFLHFTGRIFQIYVEKRSKTAAQPWSATLSTICLCLEK